MNETEYAKLPAQEMIFEASDNIENEKLRSVLDRLLQNVPRKLCLKVGAQVMLTRNLG